MDPPEQAGWVKVSPAEYWTKLDVIENNRVRFELFRRFGVLVGSGDHHSVEFMPGFVHAGNDYGRDWRVHHYGMPGHRRDADDDVAYYEEMRDAPDVTRMPSGELVAQLLDGMVGGQAAAPPGEPAERGQRHEPRRRRRRRDHGRRRRARACAAATRRRCPGSWASSSGASTSCRSGRSRPRSPATASSCWKRCSPTRSPRSFRTRRSSR